ncbi:nucleolar and spindle-associated protein 1-A isoform X2 [Halyomorpha halys]|uniref:nucleolar and spindle-associated protein 1-A isoform X2 n=1 Tax=Halyomorpha halys TaxID=286706 RepID=UPI0006D4E667|nr:nucleolar and spindle-associated protein 1-A isoform X2 [Halyomorpha halys]
MWSKMFTKEDLCSMKYKELVVIAKQYGVYKSRSKKVNLLNKLLSIPFDQVVDNQHISVNDKSDTNLVDTNQKTDCFENMMSASPAPLRRETFEIVPYKSDTNLVDTNQKTDYFENMLTTSPAALRRETFDIIPCSQFRVDETVEKICGNIGEGANMSVVDDDLQSTGNKENLSFAKSEVSVLRQNTFNLDKPKEKLFDKTVTPTTPTVLRQGTFSIEKPNKNTLSEEMPGIVCKELKNTPVKPYIVKGAATCSPVRTRSSIHRSVASVKSIGQRIENKRTAQSERRPSSRGSKTQKNFSLNMVSATPTRIHKTSVKGGRIEKKITPSKLPNFKAIHLREFSKMESIVEHTKRKAERTKALLTPVKLNSIAETKPKGASLVISRIPVKFGLPTTAVEPKSTSFTPNRGKLSVTTDTQKNANIRKSCVPDVKDKLKFIDSPMTKVKRKTVSGAVKDITNKIASNPKKRVENVKNIVTSKMHPFSVERNRAKGRDFLQSVRMNKRFQLQMEVMRKAKV